MRLFGRTLFGAIVGLLSLPAISAHALESLAVTDESGNKIYSYRWVLYPDTAAQKSPAGMGTNWNLSSLYSKVDPGRSYILTVVPNQKGADGLSKGQAAIRPGQKTVHVKVPVLLK